MEIILSDIPVMFVFSKNGVDGSSKAFDLLESRLPSLKKRKFYGVLEGDPVTGTYRACVETVKEDNPKEMGLETWVVPGGKYERRKIENWDKNILEIGNTFGAMMKEVNIDSSRPSIEFYRSMKEMFALVPIK